jgi:hypothetical protein
MHIDAVGTCMQHMMKRTSHGNFSIGVFVSTGSLVHQEPLPYSRFPRVRSARNSQLWGVNSCEVAIPSADQVSKDDHERNEATIPSLRLEVHEERVARLRCRRIDPTHRVVVVCT